MAPRKIRTTISLLSLERIEESNIPERYRTLDIEHYKGEPSAMDALCVYCLNMKKARKTCLGLRLEGGPSTFKTFLLCYVGLHALSTGYHVRYWKLTELVDAILTQGEGRLPAKEYIKPDFVLIDDLGKMATAFQSQTLNNVLVSRKDAGRPTLVATSLDEAQFLQTYGEDNARLLEQYAKTVHTLADDTVIEEWKLKTQDMFNEEV